MPLTNDAKYFSPVWFLEWNQQSEWDILTKFQKGLKCPYRNIVFYEHIMLDNQRANVVMSLFNSRKTDRQQFDIDWSYSNDILSGTILWEVQQA